MKNWEAERLMRGIIENPCTEVINHLRLEVVSGGTPGSYRWRVLRHLLSQNIRPTEDMVAQRVAELRARDAAEIAEARRLADGCRDQARQFVAAYRLRTGHGPTWRELNSHLGLDSALGSRVTKRLVASHALTSSGTRYSLDVAAPA